jgi:alkylated DNA repair protein alkB homolog 6
MVATVSLGSHIVLNLRPKNTSNPPIRILQEPGSLLVTTGEMYTDYLHGIEELTADENLSEDTVANWSLLTDPEKWAGSVERKTRTSFTFRDVLKVVKIKF